jgi:hypothetical protein
VDGLGHLQPVHLVQVLLREHHQTLEVHYQNRQLVQELDPLLELV